MKNSADTLPTRIDSAGVSFKGIDWGDINVTQVHLPRGADATPLLEGMPGDLCPVPHWGYVKSGSIHVRYADGHEEVVRGGEVYHWPAGHTVWVDEDYEAIEFSPAEPMRRLLDHVKRKLGA